MHATDELPGVSEDDMPRKQANESTEPLVGRQGIPEVGCTARAVRISRSAVKSCCASERGGWGRVSEDGPGHYNPDRSEDPWGRAVTARTEVHQRTAFPDSEPDITLQTARCTKGGGKRTSRRTRRRR